MRARTLASAWECARVQEHGRGTCLQGARACKERTPARSTRLHGKGTPQHSQGQSRVPSAQLHGYPQHSQGQSRVPSAQLRGHPQYSQGQSRVPSAQPRAVAGTLSTAKGSHGYPQHSQGQSRVPSAQPRAVKGTLSTAKGSHGYPCPTSTATRHALECVLNICPL